MQYSNIGLDGLKHITDFINRRDFIIGSAYFFFKSPCYF